MYIRHILTEVDQAARAAALTTTSCRPVDNPWEQSSPNRLQQALAFFFTFSSYLSKAIHPYIGHERPFGTEKESKYGSDPTTLFHAGSRLLFTEAHAS